MRPTSLMTRYLPLANAHSNQLQRRAQIECFVLIDVALAACSPSPKLPLFSLSGVYRFVRRLPLLFLPLPVGEGRGEGLWLAAPIARAGSAKMVLLYSAPAAGHAGQAADIGHGGAFLPSG